MKLCCAARCVFEAGDRTLSRRDIREDLRDTEILSSDFDVKSVMSSNLKSMDCGQVHCDCDSWGVQLLELAVLIISDQQSAISN